MFGANENDLCEFVGRYLNAMSLPKDIVDAWAESDASGETLPVHDVIEGSGWDTVETAEGKSLNLFPFSRHAITYLYNTMLQENYRTPRYLLRDVVEKTVRDALWNFDNFPGFKINNTNINSSLRDAIQRTGVSSEMFEQIYLFMCVWGDASTNIYDDNGTTFIAGLSSKVYEDMNFPLINGKKVSKKEQPSPTTGAAKSQPENQNKAVKTPAQTREEKNFSRSGHSLMKVFR